ncbi:MarR family transcriptional regulator [Plantactinospora sp. KLBMP9567]|uniref:MarR family winged helix-turn-helix transcriptional regulator n=1 Tax=Plantactinospora sp. KLBMP9567 TaxID=3085900 RepID=UPI0029824D9F|nr:MarR family transcriptional regulator [Plantactinospora sp. KLBMP9567]MDW5326220.1 MarR family transcriptional regulator [Plantactinospora sp. KLBMP9567]
MAPHEREFRNVFALVSRGLKSVSTEGMRRLGLHPGQNFLLEELWREDRQTPGELARRIGVEVPTITRTTQRMEAAGLLTRIPDEHDRRVVRIGLTDRGRALRDELPDLLDRAAGRALAGLTDPERAQLVGMLRRIAENLHNPAAGDRSAGH